MKNILIQLYFSLTYLLGFGQTLQYEKAADLPDGLEEASGIAFLRPHYLFHINDSGNEAEIFVTDTAGKLLLRRRLEGIENKDWEELTIDEKGFLYIGDFGNNLNKREDLVIYKISSRDILESREKIDIAKISFRYRGQYQFPPEKQNRNYDMEAMIHRGDHLYLFSKNRTSPFSGYTYCYTIPDSAGSFIAEKIDSFKTAEGVMESQWISGAAYEESSGTLVLLGYDKLWFFKDFSGKRFFNGSNRFSYFNNFSQKEAIAFGLSGELWFTEEKNSKNDGNLYRIDTGDQEKTGRQDSTASTAFLRYHDFRDELNIVIYCRDSCHVLWEAFNTEGHRLHFGKMTGLEKGINEKVINTREWKNGAYVMNIILNGIPHAYRIRKPL